MIWTELFTGQKKQSHSVMTMTTYPNFHGLFTASLWIWYVYQVTLFTRGKAPIAQQLPGESDADFDDFSSKVCRCVLILMILMILSLIMINDNSNHQPFLLVHRSCTWKEIDKILTSSRAVSLLKVSMLSMTSMVGFFVVFFFNSRLTVSRIFVWKFHLTNIRTGREAVEVEPILDALPKLEQ